MTEPTGCQRVPCENRSEWWVWVTLLHRRKVGGRWRERDEKYRIALCDHHTAEIEDGRAAASSDPDPQRILERQPV
jgi:hypothetical protein